MPKVWRDKNGGAWEIKIQKGQTWYRRLDKSDDKWRKGTPPGWTDKAKIPLGQRSAGE